MSDETDTSAAGADHTDLVEATPIRRILVPRLLDGPFEHLVITTFGADLDFFEGPLWTSLGQTRNRVVLADDLQLANDVHRAASGGSRLRHANINYVVSPVTNPRAAHAKMILLTGREFGRLFVGSGNLNLDGYAGQGEMFCQFDIANDELAHAGAFRAVRELLDGLVARGYVDAQAREHVGRVWLDAPWSRHQPHIDDRAVVRHNLKTSFLDQLTERVGAEPVEEIVVHAPFYDERCAALRRLVERLDPGLLTVLVQSHRSSVDPGNLARVVGSARSHRVLTAEAAQVGTYLHAKFVIVRQPERAICLAGSPNMSIVAFCRSVDENGNIELANLLVGARHDFDYLMKALHVTDRPVDPASLLVEFLGGTERESRRAALRIVSAWWDGNALRIELSAPVPDGSTLEVLVGGAVIPAPHGIAVSDATIVVKPGIDAATLFDWAVPVSVRISVGAEMVESLSALAYHRVALQQLLSGRRDQSVLRGIGGLDIEDEEISRLLEELDAALVIDAASIWRHARATGALATKPSEPTTGGDRRSWELVWNEIQDHPSVKQYRKLDRTRGDVLGPTDLQVILASITARFRALDQVRDLLPTTEPSNDLIDGDALADLLADLDLDLSGEAFTTEEEAADESLPERERNEQERERRRLSIAARNRMAWRRAVDRCLDGLSDPAFVALVGPDVAVVNWVVFNHLVALLVARGRVDPSYGIPAQLRLWRFLWGSGPDVGYVGGLEEKAQLDAMAVIADHGGDIVTLAGVYRAARITEESGWAKVRVELRDVWRHLLESSMISFTPDVVAAAAREVPISGDGPALVLASTLQALADEWRPTEVMVEIASALGSGPNRLRLVDALVTRASVKVSEHELTFEDSGVDFTIEMARRVLSVWLAVDPKRSYFRVNDLIGQRVAFYDADIRQGAWAVKTNDELTELGALETVPPKWARASTALLEAARRAETAAA